MLFQDMGDAVLGGLGGINFEIWEVLFQDMGGAVWGGGERAKISRYGRCCFKI